MRTFFLPRFLPRAGLAFFLLLSGCLNPSAVVDFASAAQETLALSDGYGRDMMASCERIKLAQPSDLDCSRSDVYPAVHKVRTMLTAYISNLQRLADNDKATFSENFDHLEEEIGALEKFNEDKISALRKVGSFIAEAAASGYRRRELIKLIPGIDSDFAKVVGGLVEFLDNDYREHLKDELAAVESRLRVLKADFEIKEPLAYDIARGQFERQRNEAKLKMASIDKYIESLRMLVVAHHELAVRARTIDTEEVLAQLKTYAAEIKKLNKEVKAAF